MIVAVYALVILTVGFLVGRKPASSESCFLAGRSLRWPVIGAAWAPLIGKAKSMFDYLQAVQSNMMIPFAAIFFLGACWKRITTAGVLACVATSSVVSRMFLWNGARMKEGAATFIPFMDNPYLKPFTHSAMIAGCISVSVLIAVSLFTTPASEEKLAQTTIYGATFAQNEEMVAWYADYRMWLSVAIATAAGHWIFFSI